LASFLEFEIVIEEANTCLAWLFVVVLFEKQCKALRFNISGDFDYARCSDELNSLLWSGSFE
jgi:hypothetical protein